MAVHQYIGARYVPKFYENSNGTSEWQGGVIYEPLTIVTYNGNSYTSKKPVPADVGNPSANTSYWVATGVFNEQLESVLEELQKVQQLETDNTTTPEYYGAVGDGIHDDTNAINDAIASGKKVIFNPDKQYVANVSTPTEYVEVDFCNSTIIGSITINAPSVVGYGDKNRTRISNCNIVSNGEFAVKIKDGATRACIENCDITARVTGIICGESYTPIDAFINNCFINKESGYEDTSGYGVELVGTDSKILNCRIYGFKYGAKSSAVDTYINDHFLYRGFGAEWDNAAALLCSGFPIIDTCYFDTYKTAIEYHGDCYPTMNNCNYYSWRNDIGRIEHFIKTNGRNSKIMVNNLLINLSQPTYFKFSDANPTTTNGSAFWYGSQLTNIFESTWSKTDTYDITRKTLKNKIANSTIDANAKCVLGRFYAAYEGTYLVKHYLNNGTYNTIKIRVTNAQITVDIVENNNSGFTYSATGGDTNRTFTLYAQRSESWVFIEPENISELEPLGLQAYITNPIIET